MMTCHTRQHCLMPLSMTRVTHISKRKCGKAHSQLQSLNVKPCFSISQNGHHINFICASCFLILSFSLLPTCFAGRTPSSDGTLSNSSPINDESVSSPPSFVDHDLDEGKVMKKYLQAIFDKYQKGGHLTKVGIDELLQDLEVSRQEVDDEDHDHDDHHDEDEEEEDKPVSAAQYTTAAVKEINAPGLNCIRSSEDVLSEGNLDHDAEMNASALLAMLPHIVYSMTSSCVERDLIPEEADETKTPLMRADSAQVWGISIGSVTAISLLSVIGLLTLPLINHSQLFHRLLSFLVALAVGTLVGDALLHLLPHVFMEEEEGHGGHGHENMTENIQKSLVVIAGVYIFFLFESILGMVRKFKRKRRMASEHNHSDHGGASKSTVMTDLHPDADTVSELLEKASCASEKSGYKRCTLAQAEAFDDCSSCSNSPDIFRHHHHSALHNDHQVAIVLDTSSSSTGQLSSRCVCDNHHGNDAASIAMLTAGEASNSDDLSSFEAHHHHHHHHHHDHGDFGQANGIMDMAWMVICGDGLHNFSDGLAIGAAFSSSISAGMSTTCAVFCHELPHELGDFAVLIKAGMSVKKAIVYNLLSASLAYAGLFIGLLVGENVSSVRTWILALTAGGFLYVALTDMVPQMVTQSLEKDGKTKFLFQNIGFILGVCLMLCIALYEESFEELFTPSAR